MGEPLKVMDLKEVTCNFLGVPLDELGGWGEGGAISITKEGPSFTFKKGMGGAVARSKTYDRVFTVKIMLLQTASANAVLSGILKNDEEATNGAGVGAILVRDRQGLTSLAGAEAWIDGWPKEVKFGNVVADLEWTIIVADGEYFVGGN